VKKHVALFNLIVDKRSIFPLQALC
jgi:hypothetical protein